MLKKCRAKGVNVFVGVEIVGGRVMIFWEVQTGVTVTKVWKDTNLLSTEAILERTTKLITKNACVRTHYYDRLITIKLCFDYSVLIYWSQRILPE